MSDEEKRGYRPIADYAAIGDCHGGALVAADGDIDWCALGRFDADPVFCRLLDARRGGYLSLRPRGEFQAKRAYVPGTNVLRTELACAHGRIALTDFMPLGRQAGSRANDYTTLEAPHALVRVIEALEGEVEVALACRRSTGFAAGAAGDAPLDSDIALALDDSGVARGGARIRAGERRVVVLGARAARLREESGALERTTTAFWREWIGYCRYAGPFADAVGRSALALKLMTYAPTGAAVAAFTTSLPEEIGGERNWDYRCSWVRDTSLMLHALAALGYSGEAQRFLDCARRLLDGPIERLQIMYGVGMERELEERTLAHLEGYRGSRPVRAGNAAYRQRQTDLYGYLAEAMLVYREMGGRLTSKDRAALERMVAFIAGCWPEPDSGLWEVRDERRHFVHSKAMCWVVVDRALRLCGERDDWLALRRRMHEELLAKGRAGGHFVQSYGAPAETVDAALLHLPLLALPADGETWRLTREAVERFLRRGDLVYRYRGPDGLAGDEGAFVACSFWLVEALLLEGRHDEARELFARLAARANDVGLFSEQISGRDGAFLGNFPQAFTHLALVGAAVSLELAQRDGPRAMRGPFAERARRAIGPTIGWRGLLAGLLRYRRGRLVSSRASTMPRG